MFDFASRIAKLDAVSLDKEFLSFLKREITGLLSTITSETTLQTYGPEITLFVKFLIWKFTTFSTGSTIGQKLLGIKYASLPGKLKLLFLLEGLIPYAIERLDSVRENSILQQIRQPLKQAEGLFRILHIVNFCLFLIQNRYPTVASRLLRLPMVPVSLRFGPSAGYSYQIRELLWHQFADFLITILPLINFQKLKRSVMEWIRPGPPSGTEINNFTTNAPESKRTVIICNVCNEDAVIPQRVGNEWFCYFCYQAFIDEKF